MVWTFWVFPSEAAITFSIIADAATAALRFFGSFSSRASDGIGASVVWLTDLVRLIGTGLACAVDILTTRFGLHCRDYMQDWF